jgi:hypothetical protein
MISTKPNSFWTGILRVKKPGNAGCPAVFTAGHPYIDVNYVLFAQFRCMAYALFGIS